MLFVDRQAVGVIEAKKDESILTAVEEQTERYATSQLKWRKDTTPLPFYLKVQA